MRRFLPIPFLALPLGLSACDAPPPAPPEPRSVTKSASPTPPAPAPVEPIRTAPLPVPVEETPEPTPAVAPSPTPRPVPTQSIGGGRLPLARILDIAQSEVPGEVIEVELDEDDGVEVYEIAILTSSGRKIEMEIDARTGRILDVEED